MLRTVTFLHHFDWLLQIAFSQSQIKQSAYIKTNGMHFPCNISLMGHDASSVASFLRIERGGGGGGGGGAHFNSRNVPYKHKHMILQ